MLGHSGSGELAKGVGVSAPDDVDFEARMTVLRTNMETVNGFFSKIMGDGEKMEALTTAAQLGNMNAMFDILAMISRIEKPFAELAKTVRQLENDG